MFLHLPRLSNVHTTFILTNIALLKMVIHPDYTVHPCLHLLVILYIVTFQRLRQMIMSSSLSEILSRQYFLSIAAFAANYLQKTHKLEMKLGCISVYPGTLTSRGLIMVHDEPKPRLGSPNNELVQNYSSHSVLSLSSWQPSLTAHVRLTFSDYSTIFLYKLLFKQEIATFMLFTKKKEKDSTVLNICPNE